MMKYRNKVPPTDRGLSEILLSTGWKKIREPNNLLVAMILSVPFMMVNTLVTVYLVPPVRNWLAELGKLDNNISFSFTIDIRLIFYAVIVFAWLVIHELIHAVFIPNFINSQKTFWGITPFGGFISTTEEVSKGRFILISIFPFIVLSIIMPLVLAFFKAFNGFVAFIAIMNALASSVDTVNMLLVVFQVPNGCRIINNGLETYFKQSI